MPDSIIKQVRSQIPVTKLRPPSTQETIVRDSLISQLREGLDSHRLLLLSAPAGSGKTTLAADFVRTAEECTIRWLTLDAGDNDTTIFLLAFVVAIGLQPDTGILDSIMQGHMASRQVANVLINMLDMDNDQPFVLVLDDLHLVTNTEIYEFLDYFIDHVPTHFHLLITTRYDPPLSLTRWRTRGELMEIRLNHLRFQRAEVSVFLNQVLQLNIPDELIGQMVDRTEGWIAGLRLLAFSLERVDAAQREQYITNLAERDRYVFDLLAEEVLSQQPEAMQKFLLQTAILDALTPQLCIAVTQQPDAADKLRELHRHNLFLVSLGDGTYRYHALFQNFLQTFLKYDQPTLLKTLHLRAADSHSMPYRKIHHYLAAEAWEPAIALVSQ
ncbi:hypothetical protein KC957_03720, partial [Candidatus Saccharibacteria bacterium]|nr:hypothetical protein [Candidatus Saccharibacteria bacterium]